MIDRGRALTLIHVAWVPLLVLLCWLALATYSREYPTLGRVLERLGWAISSS
jgi:hypothetical protein